MQYNLRTQPDGDTTAFENNKILSSLNWRSLKIPPRKGNKTCLEIGLLSRKVSYLSQNKKRKTQQFNIQQNATLAIGG